MSLPLKITIILIMAVLTSIAQPPYVTEVTEYKKPFAPPELRLGPVNFYPRLGFQSMYDDNIYASTSNEKSDFIWSLSPGFLAAAGDTDLIALYRKKDWSLFRYNPENLLISDPQNWPRQMYLLDYSPQFNWFSKYTDNNATDHHLNAGAYIPFSKSIISIRQNYTHQTTTIIEANRRSAQDIVSTGIAGGIQLGPKSSIYTLLSRNDYSYERKDLYGYTDYSSETWFNWNTTPKITLSGGLTLGMFDVQKQPNQYYEQLRFRARYHPSERVWLDSSFGIQFRQFSGGRSTTEPVGSIAAYYHWREKTYLSLSAARSEYASIAWGNYNYLQTGFGFGISQLIGDRITISLNPGYYNLDYIWTKSAPSANRTDDYFYVSASVNVKLYKYLEGSIFYNHLTRTSNVSDDLTYNRAGIQIVWHY